MTRCMTSLFLLSFLAAGCSSGTIGHEFSFDTLRTFKIGQTTKPEVLQAMGEPYGRFPEKNGNESWLYMHTKTEATNFVATAGIDQKGKTAIFLFKGDRLVDLYWEEKTQQTQSTALGTAQSGRLVSQSDVDSLVPGKTTTREALNRFGPPNVRRYRLDDSEMWVYAYVDNGKSRTAVLNFERGVLTRTGAGGDSK